MTDSENPYASPPLEASAAARTLPPESASEDEQIRRRHLSVETSVRALGGLFFIVGVVALFFIVHGVWQRDTSSELVYLLSWGVGFSGLIVLGLGLRFFQPWARVLTAVLLVMFMASVLLLPWEAWLMGGVQLTSGAYALYLMFGPQGRFVFSAEYAAIRSRTPHIKYQPGNGILVVLLMIIVAIFLGLLLPAIH